MKKRIAVVICIFCMILPLLGCSKDTKDDTEPVIQHNSNSDTKAASENIDKHTVSPSADPDLLDVKAVPESVVLRNSNYNVEAANEYTITHNYDEASHIDDAELILYYEDTYGTETLYVPYAYQYDKSSDLWIFLEEGETTTTRQINANAYIDKSPWVGTVEGYRDYSYSITFLDIDADQMIATISFEIDFENDEIPDLSRKTVVDIIPDTGDHILIEYTYTRDLGNNIYSTEEESLWFWLKMNAGLQPF